MLRFHALLALAVVTTAGAVQAQTRTWGFAKDTVYEWASGGDSVLLANSGTDTLSFDSIGIEIVRPLGEIYQVAFEFYNPTTTANPKYHVYRYYNGVVSWPPLPGPKGLKVATGSSAALKDFKGNVNVNPVNKRAAIVENDTVVTRLIFLASNNRGRDTLIFYSKQDGPSVLRAIGLKGKSPRVNGALYDLRGRRQETVPNAVRVPFRAIVTDGKKN